MDRNQNLNLDIWSNILSGSSKNTSIGHIFSVFLKTKSLFYSISWQFTEQVIFHKSCAPSMVSKMNLILIYFSFEIVLIYTSLYQWGV